MSEASGDRPRASAFVLCLLGGAVAAGALFLGAPPRFSAGDSGPAWLRTFLVSLGPLSIVEAAAAAGLAVLAANECLRSEAPGLPGGPVAARMRLPLIALMVLGLLQLVPLPRGALEAVAPFSASTYASLTATGDDTLRPISLWPAGTAHALFNLAGVLAASAAVWALVRSPASRRTATGVLVFVAALATFEALAGLAATYLGDDRLLFTFEKISGRTRVTGTFVHGTMMAVWAGMGACAALALAASASLGEVRRGPRVVLASAAAVVCVVAALLTLSRLGFVAVTAGLLVTWFALAGAARHAGRGGLARAMTASGALLVAGAVAAMLAVPAFRQRIGYLFAGGHGVTDPRFPAWSSTWELFRESPVLGTGLGSFGRAIHLTQSPDSPQELWYAHSDPLNLLSDVGVVGALLGAVWVLWMLSSGAPALKSADSATRCLAAGAFGGAVVVLVASLGDFQTQFPVVAIPFAALLTVPAALADAARPRESGEERTTWLLPPRWVAAFVFVVGAGAAAIPLVESVARARELRESGVARTTRAETLVAQGRAELALAQRAPDPRAAIASAETKLREAARLDPLLDEAHLWTAFAALLAGESNDDVLRALGRARRVARGHAQVNLVAGKTYLDLLGTGPAPHGPPGDGALPALREAGALEPRAFTAAWKLAIERKLPVESLAAITPDRGFAKITLFEHLVSLGRRDEAIAVLEEQLAREPWDIAVSTRLSRALTAAGRETEGRALFERLGAPWDAP